MHYKKYQNNNKMSKAYGKWYLKPVITAPLSTSDLAQIIQSNASVKESDVVAVLKEMKEVMQTYLGLGFQIHLEGIGTFQTRAASTGALTPEECTPAKCISRTSVLFKPEVKKEGSAYVKPLLKKLTWKELTDYTKPKSDADGDGDEQNP